MSERTPMSRSPALRKFIHEADKGDLYQALPFSDLRRWFSDTSIYVQALSVPALSRLGQLKPIGFLSYLGPETSRNIKSLIGYHHTRYEHSLAVGFVGETIGKNNRLSQHEIMILRLGGFFHDVGTPAFGDTIKQLDPKNLNEEDFWWEALGEKGQAFVRRFTNRETLDKVIKNEGVLGEILDIADRITYTMNDLYAVQHTARSNPLAEKINIVLSVYPKIGNVYKDVCIDKTNRTVFFKDPDRLYAFLKIRAILHKELYLHPISQGRELFLTKAVEHLYSPANGPLTPSLLRKIGDHQLLLILQETYPETFMQDSDYHIRNWFPFFERFETEEEAKQKEKELEEQKDILVVGIKPRRSFNAGVSYKVVNQDGNIVLFSEAKPKETQELQEMGESTKGIFLFWADVSEDSPTSNLLKAVLRKQ